MLIIPAIDIMDEKVVRLEQGKFERIKIYSENPVLTAREWKEKGAKLLHVVDLDGARLGKPVNLDVVQEIVKNVKVDIELGGGLRTIADVESAFKTGARYAVLGTGSVLDKAFCEESVKKYGDKIIFAVDVKDGKVAIRGWKEISEKEPTDYVKELETLGGRKIIYTDISRDGMMRGPNLETLRNVLGSVSLEVIVSGGVASIEDIKVLKGFEKSGVKGVIIGKALYEGRLDLKEVIRVGEENNTVS